MGSCPGPQCAARAPCMIFYHRWALRISFSPDRLQMALCTVYLAVLRMPQWTIQQHHCRCLMPMFVTHCCQPDNQLYACGLFWSALLAFSVSQWKLQHRQCCVMPKFVTTRLCSCAHLVEVRGGPFPPVVPRPLSCAANRLFCCDPFLDVCTVFSA